MFWVVVASNAGAVIYQAENRADPLEKFESLDDSLDYARGQDRPAVPTPADGWCVG